MSNTLLQEMHYPQAMLSDETHSSIILDRMSVSVLLLLVETCSNIRKSPPFPIPKEFDPSFEVFTMPESRFLRSTTGRIAPARRRRRPLQTFAEHATGECDFPGETDPAHAQTPGALPADPPHAPRTFTATAPGRAGPSPVPLKTRKRDPQPEAHAHVPPVALIVVLRARAVLIVVLRARARCMDVAVWLTTRSSEPPTAHGRCATTVANGAYRGQPFAELRGKLPELREPHGVKSVQLLLLPGPSQRWGTRHASPRRPPPPPPHGLSDVAMWTDCVPRAQGKTPVPLPTLKASIAHGCRPSMGRGLGAARRSSISTSWYSGGGGVHWKLLKAAARAVIGLLGDPKFSPPWNAEQLHMSLLHPVMSLAV